MVQLLGYRVNKMSIDNTVENGTQIKLKPGFEYKVNYSDSENKCLGILKFRITDADMKPFEINIDMVAEFSYEEDDDKSDIHVLSFDQIFPFVRQIVNILTSQAGMPGLMIPIMHLNKSAVQVNPAGDGGEKTPLN